MTRSSGERPKARRAKAGAAPCLPPAPRLCSSSARLDTYTVRSRGPLSRGLHSRAAVPFGHPRPDRESGGPHGPGTGAAAAAAFRPDFAPRPLVGSAAAGLPRAVHLHRLLDVGGVPGRSLLLRQRAHYLSPFYSPELFGDSPHAWFGPKPAWWPGWLPFSPALLILWAPGGFRFTCYYYRGAYYKAFWADPPSCAVGEPRKSYWGEHVVAAHPAERPPLLPLPGAASSSCSWPTTSGRRCGSPTRRRQNVTSASASARWCWRSTSSCWAATPSAAIRCGTWSAAASTSCRARRCAATAYDCVSCLNRRHMLWAWCSLFWVGFTDLYVRLCSMGSLARLTSGEISS